MKKILLLSAAVMAVLASPVFAQDNGDRSGRDRGGDRGGPARAAPAAPAAAPAAPARAAPPSNRAEQGRQSMQREQQQRAANPTVNRRDAGRNNGNNAPTANRGNDNRGNFANRNDNRPGPGNNNAYRGGARPNYSQYQRAFNAPQRYRYRGPAYVRPSGWYYRRWNYGQVLPSLFWTNNYWINDFFDYGLMAPPPGTVWVRYGPDAVLIDRYTGEVIQVEYNAFY